MLPFLLTYTRSQARWSWGIDFIMMPWLLPAMVELELAEPSSWCVESFLEGGPAVLWSGGEAGLQTCAVGGSRTCITWRASRSQLYRSTLSQASLVSTHRPATANQSSPGRCHCLVCINLHVFAYKYTRLADPLGTHPEWHFLASSMSISRFCSSYPFTSTDKSKKIIY